MDGVILVIFDKIIFSKLFCRFTGKDYETDNDDKTEAATTQIDNEKVLESFHFDI